MKYHEHYVDYLIAKGGPDTPDYSDFDAWIHEVSDQLKDGVLSAQDKKHILAKFGEALSEKTMQGFAFLKPHGYAGDFEIIDRIYKRYEAQESHLRKWDSYWQSHAAANAVRNRNEYFARVLLEREEQQKDLRVLNVASGPGRDMYNFFQLRKDSSITIDCIEQDRKAITYASGVCSEHMHQITFIPKNALKLNLEGKYDFIWSAGLFDYFSDKVFVYVLKKLLQLLAPTKGEIVVGNFSTLNPSRKYMELFEWTLQHRSPQRLLHLAAECGVDKKNMTVNAEKEGVNLFLHIVTPDVMACG